MKEAASGDDTGMRRQQLAHRLRQAREYVGMSQEDVAKALGISRPAITHIESGTRRVEALELEKLSSLYGLPVPQLLGSEEPEAIPRTAFLARATKGLTQRDMEELGRFAAFLRSSARTRQ